ncbi:MAG: hypothetical protein JSV80_16390 [Acidobacteriota bacterium]|nr:MAG: hypothetical protein JSV80_16390 [Acidobacteriota bacterium]
MRNRGKTSRAVLVAAAVLLMGASMAQAGAADELTPQAAAVVEQLFPNATIVDVGRERENGVRFYEVMLRIGDREIEIEVTASGEVGEIEMLTTLDELPPAARRTLEMAGVSDASILRVERHERRGVPTKGSVVALDVPKAYYEIEYRSDRRREEIVLTAEGMLSMSKDDHASDDDHSSDDEPLDH